MRTSITFLPSFCVTKDESRFQKTSLLWILIISTKEVESTQIFWKICFNKNLFIFICCFRCIFFIKIWNLFFRLILLALLFRMMFFSSISIALFWITFIFIIFNKACFHFNVFSFFRLYTEENFRLQDCQRHQTIPWKLKPDHLDEAIKWQNLKGNRQITNKLKDLVTKC